MKYLFNLAFISRNNKLLISNTLLVFYYIRSLLHYTRYLNRIISIGTYTIFGSKQVIILFITFKCFCDGICCSVDQCSQSKGVGRRQKVQGPSTRFTPHSAPAAACVGLTGVEIIILYHKQVICCDFIKHRFFCNVPINIFIYVS